MTIRVLIADDQALVRAGFVKILDSEGGIEVVGEAADGEEAVTAALDTRPDVVVMDIRMPRLDGIAATGRIVAGAPSGPRVLVLTTYGIDDYVFEALRAGASGFMLKDAPPEDLIDAIRTVAAGEALLDPTVTRAVIDEFVRRSPRAAKPQALPAQLTERELHVLKLLTRGYSNTEIAGEMFVSEATVKTHITHVLTKLAVRDRVQAVIYAYETGLVQPGQSPFE
jgi:DNA-binding NarL/FixJ family response regulator